MINENFIEWFWIIPSYLFFLARDGEFGARPIFMWKPDLPLPSSISSPSISAHPASGTPLRIMSWVRFFSPWSIVYKKNPPIFPLNYCLPAFLLFGETTRTCNLMVVTCDLRQWAPFVLHIVSSRCVLIDPLDLILIPLNLIAFSWISSMFRNHRKISTALDSFKTFASHQLYRSSKHLRLQRTWVCHNCSLDLKFHPSCSGRIWFCFLPLLTLKLPTLQNVWRIGPSILFLKLPQPHSCVVSTEQTLSNSVYN